jgi:MHS family shikimate/dehydroshikimate transporter-like MFS transporter
VICSAVLAARNGDPLWVACYVAASSLIAASFVLLAPRSGTVSNTIAEPVAQSQVGQS